MAGVGTLCRWVTGYVRRFRRVTVGSVVLIRRRPGSRVPRLRGEPGLGALRAMGAGWRPPAAPGTSLPGAPGPTFRSWSEEPSWPGQPHPAPSWSRQSWPGQSWPGQPYPAPFRSGADRRWSDAGWSNGGRSDAGWSGIDGAGAGWPGTDRSARDRSGRTSPGWPVHEPAGRWREADASVHAVEHRSPQEILRFAQSAVREMTLGNEAAERALAVADMAAFGAALHLIDRASVDYDQAALAWDDVVCFHGTRGFDLPVKPERLQSVRLFGWDRRTPPVRGN